MSEIKVGDRVRIRDNGKHYNTHYTWGRKHLTGWTTGPKVDDGEEGVVLSIAPHGTFDIELFGIRLDNGKLVIFEIAGIEFVSGPKKLKLPLAIKSGSTSYVLVAGDGDRVTMVLSEDGSVYKNHTSEANALTFLQSGVWTVVSSTATTAALEEAVEDAKADVVAAERALALAKSSLAQAEAELANYKPNYLE